MRTSIFVALLGWSSLAAAQPVATQPVATQPETPVETPAKPKKYTVMLAPLRLIVPLVELTFEYRVADKLGISATAGGGRRTIESGSSEASGNEIEGGAQVRYYAVGDFEHGMEVGVEALYEYVKFDEPLPPGILAVAAGGLTIGPFLGYKIATGIGFTFEAQLGARYLAVEPTVQGSGGAVITESKWLPLLHLNIGWSF